MGKLVAVDWLLDSCDAQASRANEVAIAGKLRCSKSMLANNLDPEKFEASTGVESGTEGWAGQVCQRITNALVSWSRELGPLVKIKRK